MRKVKFKVVNVGSGGTRYSVYASAKYRRMYSRGTIVITEKETLGIFVFQTRKQAEIFISNSYLTRLRIIRVSPIGRGKTVDAICYSVSSNALDAFYEKLYSFDKIEPPPGTILYPAVEVLE